MRPEWSRLERQGRARQVWDDSQRRFLGSVMGPRFEQVCRDWAQDYAPADLFAAPVAHVGHGVVNDPEHRTAHEIDVVISGNDPDGRRVLLGLGEAKWQEPMGTGHLDRLKRVRQLLTAAGHPGAETAKLLCFSAAEPSPHLRAAGDAGEVTVVGLNELYTAL